MKTRRHQYPRRRPASYIPQVEALESRSLLSASIPGVTLDPSQIPKFVNPLPQPLDPSFVYQPTGTTTVTLANGATANAPLYTVGAYEIQQDLGLGLTSPVTGQALKTTVYGYGSSPETATYPGRSFVVQSGSPVAVNWINGLTSNTHVLPVDPTVLDPEDEGILYTVTPQTVVDTPVTGTTQALLTTFNTGIPTVPHVHGGHTQAAFDGTPQQWFTPTGLHGTDFPGTTTFTYDNSQQAGTIWYHDHTMGVTRLNVYAGLAGFYIIHDTNENNLIARHSLPDERYDIPLAIQDRMFTEGGQLYYPAEVLPGTTATYPSQHPEFFGDTILVNGKAWPVMDVEPRLYRFRVLNGSNARFYNLHLDAPDGTSRKTFSQIGTDNGLLGAPVALDSLLVGPGERADIVIDFSNLAGQSFILTNDANGPFPDGDPADPETTGQIMKFRVSLPKSSVPDAVLPAKLNTIVPLQTTNAPRQMALFEKVDGFGRLIQQLGTPSNGGVPFMDSRDAADTVQLIRNADGTQSVTETWQVYNNTVDVHPIHLHQVSFQIVSRQSFSATLDPVTSVMTGISLIGAPTSPLVNEAGWKDTAQMFPGTVTTIIAKYDLPGTYVWHCHILEHEENDMMHWLIVNPATTVSMQEGVNGYAGMTDTTIKSDFPTATTGASAATVEANDNPDRGTLLRWSLASIPAGSVVQSASITLKITNTTKQAYALYELLRSWTEGSATWNQTAAGTPWRTAGAQKIGVDRASTALASLTSPKTGLITINLNAAGIALVQKWINTPSTNFGITIQNYATSSGDAVAFESSEAITAANRPKLSITYSNNPPTANGDSYSVSSTGTLNASDATGTAGGTGNDGVLVNDTDPENNPLSAILVESPAHASAFHLNPNGTFTYAHKGDKAIIDSFTYRASDGSNLSNVTRVTITILPATTVSLQEGINGYSGMIDTTIKSDFPTATTGASAATVEAKDNPDRGSLLRWNLASIPAGSVVQSASITLKITNTTNQNYAFYELLRSWTEGSATWNQTAAGTPWGTAGAQKIGVDRASTVLASLTSPKTGLITINLNAAGIALVQKWIKTPSTNFGITIQNYATSSGDAVAFESSEAITSANRPKLTVTYGPGTSTKAASLPSVTRSAQTGSNLTGTPIQVISQPVTAKLQSNIATGTPSAVSAVASASKLAGADLSRQTLGSSIPTNRNAAGFGSSIDWTRRGDSEIRASYNAGSATPADGRTARPVVVAQKTGRLLSDRQNSTPNVLRSAFETGHPTATSAGQPSVGALTHPLDAFFQELSSHPGGLAGQVLM